MNPLYPAFFRLDRLQMLVVGAGEVGEEKLSFILKSSPNARAVIVAPWMGEELRELLDGYDKEARSQVQAAPQPPEGESKEQWGEGLPSARFAGEEVAGEWKTKRGGEVVWYAREFRPSDVEITDLVVAATNFREVNHAVWQAAKAARRLANIADTPALCDFYLGSIVTRGPLKVAISTNGQSPTFAKRFRQFLEAELPELETTNLLDNLRDFRDRLTGNFQTKVRELNTLTSGLLSSAAADGQPLRACPPGGCIVAAAGREVYPPRPSEGGSNSPDLASTPAPATAPENITGEQAPKPPQDDY